MSILNRALYGVIAVLLVVFSLSAYKASKLEGEVNTLTSELKAATAVSESLRIALNDAKAKAVQNNKDTIKKSTERAKAKTKVQAIIKESRDEAKDEVVILIPDSTLDRLQRLTDKANAVISATGNTK